VLFIFSGEAVLLGILGGVIGFLCGSLIAAFVMRTVFAVSSGFSPAYAGTALLVSLLIALTGGSGAMMAVFRLDPVRSLRGE
jgi:putative ABC transport system permease protein